MSRETPPDSPTAAPPLQYARESSTRFAYEPTPDGVVVQIHHAPPWTASPAAARVSQIGVGLLTFAIVLPPAVRAFSGLATVAAFALAISVATLAALGLAAVSRRAANAAREPMVIELTAASLSFRNFGDEGQVNRTIPRSAIYACYHFGSTGTLVVRAHGHEMFDCHPSPDPRDTQWLADLLCNALRLDAATGGRERK